MPNDDLKQNGQRTNEVVINFEEYILEIRKINNELISVVNDNQNEITEQINQHLDRDLTVNKILDMIDVHGVKNNKDELYKFLENIFIQKAKSINHIVEHKVNKFNDETARYINGVERKFVKSSGLKFGSNVNSWFVSGIESSNQIGALSIYDSHSADEVNILTSFGINQNSAPVPFTRFYETISSTLSFTSIIFTRLVSLAKANIGWKKELAQHIRKNAIETIIPEINDNNRKLWEETKGALAIGFEEVIIESQKAFIEVNKDIIDDEKTKE